MNKLLCALIIIIALTPAGSVQAPQRIFLSVYYESNCPDSKAFILQQLQPALQLLRDHIMLQLIPFGKSRSINYGNNGFVCQHGPKECLGNMVQDCALDLMPGVSDAERLAYVACEMATEAASKGDLQCVVKANLPANVVETCLRSGKGTELQLNSEYLTMLVKPKFVPTVTINGMFNQQIQDNAQIDLLGTLCSILKETQECAQHYNNIALTHLLSYPLRVEHVR